MCFFFLPVASLRSCISLNNSLLSSGTKEVFRNYLPALLSAPLFRYSALNSANSQTPSQTPRFWLWVQCTGLHPGASPPCFRTASLLLWVCPNSCTASPRTYVFVLRLPHIGGRYKISPGRLGYQLKPSLPQVPEQSCPHGLPHPKGRSPLLLRPSRVHACRIQGWFPLLGHSALPSRGHTVLSLLSATGSGETGLGPKHKIRCPRYV